MVQVERFLSYEIGGAKNVDALQCSGNNDNNKDASRQSSKGATTTGITSTNKGNRTVNNSWRSFARTAHAQVPQLQGAARSKNVK